MVGKGEGFTGTTIKNMWTNTRGVETGEGGGDGRGGGEGWGEKQKTALEQQEDSKVSNKINK